jgi:dTDP-4-amino-4,6-dideoxygalactose transaminase
MVSPAAIPFIDLKPQLRAIGPELQAAVSRVIESGSYVLGQSVETFEEQFATYCGTRRAVAVNTGTSALHLALLAADIGPGDEVVTVPMTFVATVAAILYTGATPRFVDVEPDTWTMNPDALDSVITPRTKAIMPVHLHGRMADMDAIREIARAHGLVVIEDAAQAHGAEYRGRRAGSLGELGCFSFYPGKNLGACGEGGAVITDADDMAERIRMLRDWGQSERYRHILRGYNYRMDAIQGAVLAVKLGHLDDWTDARRRVAGAYDALLSGTAVGRPAPAGRDHVWHVYAVRTRERDKVRQRLGEAGIATGIHYPVPVHLQPAYADLGYALGSFPVSENLAAETFSLPLFPELARAEIERVCAKLDEICSTVGSYVDAA